MLGQSLFFPCIRYKLMVFCRQVRKMTVQALYKNETKRVCSRIIDKYHPQKLILFGSCANGKITPDSDVDMLIIKNSRLPRFRRAQAVYSILADLNYKVPLDIIVYTPSEFKERLRRKDFFMRDIHKEGKVLYEKN